MAAKIFISHSCKDLELQPADQQDPNQLAKWRRLEYARAVRDKIVDGLGPNGLGYKVLLDRKRLEPGDDWQAKLHAWLGTCDGALLLLSEDSVCSDWVRKEATILTWRKSLRPELLLVPILLGDFDMKALKGTGLECLQLSDSQACRLDSSDTPSWGSKVEDLSEEDRDAHATCLARKVLEKFKILSVMNVDTELEKWVQSVASRLLEAKTHFLNLARKELQVHDDDWSDDEGYLASHDLLGQTAILAHQLLNVDLGRLQAAMSAIWQGISKETFEWLAPRVACQWVDIRAAQRLLPGARPHHIKADESRLLLLNATYEETSRAYINRAHCCGLPNSRVMVVAKPIGEDFNQELLAHIERNLFYKLKLPRKLIDVQASGRKDRQELLQRREEVIEGILKGLPFYIVLDMDEGWELSEDALEGIRMARKHITYVLLTGNSLTAIPFRNRNMEYIMPELTKTKEDEGRVLEGALSLGD